MLSISEICISGACLLLEVILGRRLNSVGETPGPPQCDEWQVAHISPLCLYAAINY